MGYSFAAAVALLLLLLAAGTARASVTARHPARVVGDIPWNCSAPMNETACLELTGCYWNVFQHNCQRICSLVTTAEPCSTEPGCRWLPTPSPSGSTSNGTCTTACMFAYQEPTTCNAAVECTWDDQLSGCVGYCSFYEQLQQSQRLAEQLCKADTGCQWDAADSEEPCRAACRLAEIPETCNSRPTKCVWDPLSELCIDVVTPPPEPTTSGVPPPPPPPSTLVPTTSAAPTTPPPTAAPCRYTSAHDCDRDPYCMWNPTFSLCTRKCDGPLINGPTECNMDASCVFRGEYCQQRCEIAFLTQSACASDPFCSWSSVDSSCQPRPCDTYMQSDCGASWLCELDPTSSSCVPSCKFFVKEFPCLETGTNCAWDYVNFVCVEQQPTTTPASLEHAAANSG